MSIPPKSLLHEGQFVDISLNDNVILEDGTEIANPNLSEIFCIAFRRLITILYSINNINYLRYTIALAVHLRLGEDPASAPALDSLSSRRNHKVFEHFHQHGALGRQDEDADD